MNENKFQDLKKSQQRHPIEIKMYEEFSIPHFTTAS